MNGYEICIESFLLYNFWMDYLILLVVRLLLQCQCKLRRIAMGAAAGAILSGISLLGLSLPQVLWELITYGSCGIVMLYLGLRIRTVGNMLRGLLILFSCTIFFGGIYTALAAQWSFWNRYGTTCVTMVGTGTLLIVAVHGMIRRERRRKEQILYQVTIHVASLEKKLVALWDSGNRLIEPISSKSVSVAGIREMEDMIDHIPEGRLRLIPYYSVGCENGLLKAYRMDDMEITNELGYYKRIEAPYVGVYTKELCEGGQYQMILAADAVR